MCLEAQLEFCCVSTSLSEEHLRQDATYENCMKNCRKKKDIIHRYPYHVQFDWNRCEPCPAIFWYWSGSSLLAELDCVTELYIFTHLTYLETDDSLSELFTSEIIEIFIKSEDTYCRVDLHFSFFWRIGSLLNTI